MLDQNKDLDDEDHTLRRLLKWNSKNKQILNYL